MKIKDELLSGKLVIHVESKEQMTGLMEYLQNNTNISWGSYKLPLTDVDLWDIDSNNTCVYIKDMWLTHANLKYAKKSNEKIYKYNEIWEDDSDDLIAERMQTIADMLDIPMDTDIVLNKNGSRLIYTPHQLTNEGLLNCMGTQVNDILGNLLIGRYEIEELLFKDRIKEGGVYYFINTIGMIEYGIYSKCEYCNRLIKVGNFFETEEEASKYELKIAKREE